MRIVLKLVLWIVVLLVGLTASLAAYLMFFFNPNDYRDDIQQRALTEAGIELSINGDIGWSFYPWLGLNLNSISVNYPGQPNLAQLASAGAALNIPALLSGEVQLDSIQIDGLVLNLVRDAKGEENWVSATTATSAPSAESKETLTAQESRSDMEGRELRLAIDAISLTNASLSFEDQIWSSRLELNELNLNASAVSVERPFPIEFTGEFKQFEAGALNTQATMELKSDLSLNTLQQIIELRNLTTSMTVQQTALEQPLNLSLNADIRLNQAEQRVSIDNLKSDIAGLLLTGKLALNDFKQMNIEGQLDVAQFNPRDMATKLGLVLPELGPKDAKPVLAKAALKTSLSGNLNSLLLKDLKLNFDDTNTTGQIAVNIESGAVIANLVVDQIDLDRYSTPASGAESTSASPPSATQAGWSKEPLFDASGLRGLNADLKLQVARAMFQGNSVEQINLDLSAKAGDIRLKQLSAIAFGGQAEVSGALDARTEPVKLAVKPKFSGIKLDQLMLLAMPEAPVKADVNLSGSLTTAGNSLHTIINALNGDMQLSAAEGVIQGIDLAQELCQNIENITALGINPDQVDRTTPIADLKSNYTFNNGVVTNPSLTAGIDAAKLDAKGVVDLPAQAFDYNLGLTLTGDLFNKSCGINPALRDVRIPVNCKGNFNTDPAKLCAVDTRFIGEVFKKAIGAKAQAEIEKRKDQLEQQAKEKLQENLGDKLKGDAGSLIKGLFGN